MFFTDVPKISNHGTKPMFCASSKGKTHSSKYTTVVLIAVVRGYRN